METRACSVVVGLRRLLQGQGSWDSRTVASVPTQTGVTLEAQTGNVFSQISLLLGPEITPFASYSTGFSIDLFFFFFFLLWGPLYKC